MRLCYHTRMAELKTKKTKASVLKFLKSLPDAQKRQDSIALHELFSSVTGKKAAMWGTSIVGYGMYHYKSERSSQEGDWPLVAFSPRKQNLTLYLLGAGKQHPDLLKKLGPHTTSVGCLYIKRLSDVNLAVLKQLINKTYQEAKKKLL